MKQSRSILLFSLVFFCILQTKANDNSLNTLLERLDAATRRLTEDIANLTKIFDNLLEKSKQLKPAEQHPKEKSPFEEELAVGKEKLKPTKPEKKPKEKNPLEEEMEKRRKASGEEEEVPAQKPVKEEETVPEKEKPAEAAPSKPKKPAEKPQPLPITLPLSDQKQLNEEIEALIESDLQSLAEEIKKIDNKLEEIKKIKVITRRTVFKKLFLTEKKEYIEMLISLRKKNPEALKNELEDTEKKLATLGVRKAVNPDAVSQQEIDKLEMKIKLIEKLLPSKSEEEKKKEKEEEKEWD